ncbi:hypothetical protein FACS189428_3760 [Clostridia bacterium]|nr:hypothetical protein FACS189428_3760 [Clostridia bacterium]
MKFSTEKLVPQGVQRQSKNQYGIYPSDQKGVRKADYKGEEEYYYDFDAYEAECKKQGKNAVMKGDLEKAMQSLVGDYKE